MIACACVALVISICQLGQAELQTAVVLFRHGDRTPTSSYPSDQYAESDWPNGYGQLTTKGIGQLFTLGVRIRDRYAQSLKFNLTAFDRKMIRVRSTDYDRTLMSAHSFLDGFYAPNRVPVPIHTVERGGDYLLYDRPYCPRYEALCREAFHGKEAKSLEANMSDILSRLAQWTWTDSMNIRTAGRIWDTLFIENLYGRLPDWARKNWADISREMSRLRWANFKLTLLTEEMVRLRSSQMLREIISHMQLHATERVKLVLYSAHDSTLCAMLAALGNLDKWPPPGYGGSILIELDDNDREATISAFYSEHINASYSQLYVPCGASRQFRPNCSLEGFQASVEGLILTREQLKRKCQMKGFPYSSALLPGLQIVCLIVFLATTVLLTARALVIFRRRK